MFLPWAVGVLFPLLTVTLAVIQDPVSYDVTTILKLEETSSGVYESYGSLGVFTRGNARGLPLRRGQSFLNGTFAGQPCCASWTHEGWAKLDSASAEAAEPPLDPQETATDGDDVTGNSTSSSDKPAVIWNRDQEEYEADANNVWGGRFPAAARVRVLFHPPKERNVTLGLFLCSEKGDAERECVAFLLKGYNHTGSLLNYQAMKCSQNETGPETETPFGKLKSNILQQDDTAPARWGSGQDLHFLMERSTNGSFELRIDGGDATQRRTMILDAALEMTNLSVAVMSGVAGNDTLLEVKADPTWYGQLRPGGDVRIRWIPPNSGSAHLGIFMCQDRFQEKCVGEVLSGHIDGYLRFVVGAYGPQEKSKTPFWVAGNEELYHPMTEQARSQYIRARWDPVRPYAFSISRTLDGSIRVRLDGGDEDKDQKWTVPKDYQHLFIASYHHEGRLYVQVAQGRCSGSTACTAPAPLWVLGPQKGELRSPSIPASASGRRICVTVIARLSPGATLSVAVQVTGEASVLEMEKLSPVTETQWVTRRMVRVTSRAVRKKPFEILLTAEQPARTQDPIMVQWAATCNPDGDEDGYTVAESTSLKAVSNQIGFDVMLRPRRFIGSAPTQSNPVCMHGGVLDMATGLCRCVPGFTGTVCERGCGPNAYGEDCLGRCQRTFAGRQCRGMLLCGAGGGCDCAPGLSGPRCDVDCEPGRYGAGCRRACGRCADGVPCDPFTGYCEDGCDGTLQPPFCLEECGRQRSAVSLITNGGNARAEDYPWHTAIYDTEFRNETNIDGPATTEQICGGSLVKPMLVISAAHCFFTLDGRRMHKPSRYKVALGKTYRGWNDVESPPDRVQRSGVYLLHALTAYKGVALFYTDDIALAQLDSPIVYTLFVGPVCIDWTGGFESALDVGDKGSVVGWGLTERHVPSPILKVATLPYLPRERCLEHVPEDFWPYVARDKFCAGDKEGAAVNHGDSGGGIVFLQQGAWYLRGVVSVGPKTDLSYTAYTNISTFRDWLTTRKNEADIQSALLAAYWTS